MRSSANEVYSGCRQHKEQKKNATDDSTKNELNTRLAYNAVWGNDWKNTRNRMQCRCGGRAQNTGGNAKTLSDSIFETWSRN